MRPTTHICFPFAQQGQGRDLAIQPAVNLYHHANAWLLEVELPGVEIKDISVKLESHAIEVNASRSHKIRAASPSVFLLEISHQHFQRRIELPRSIEVKDIEIKSESGVVFILLKEKENV